MFSWKFLLICGRTIKWIELNWRAHTIHKQNILFSCALWKCKICCHALHSLNVKLQSIVHRCSLFINCTVQSYWNLLEDVLLRTTDDVIPLKNFSRQLKNTKNFIPQIIKAKVNKRKRLLKTYKVTKNACLSVEIKQLSKEIKSHFKNEKISRVRSVAMNNIKPGSIWKAVRAD